MPEIKELKSLFDTPKKARVAILCSLVALLTLGAVVVYVIYTLTAPGGDTPPSQTEAVSDTPDASELPGETVSPTQEVMGMFPTLTIDEARALALADAKVSEDEAQLTREALAEDNGIWVYEFRFHTGSDQFEYKLNANTGEIRAKVRESFAAATPGPDGTEPPAPSLPAVTASLPPVETAPAASDDPQPSGVPSASQPPASPSPEPSASPEPSPSPAPTQFTPMYIGMDRAKAIALEHAGLSASQVHFTHLQMDREDGRLVYEVEFRQGRVEYEYEIDAVTGRILEHERDEG